MRSNYRVEIREAGNLPLGSEVDHAVQHGTACSRVGEAGGADLDRIGTRDHQLDGIPPGCDASDADDR